MRSLRSTLFIFITGIVVIFTALFLAIFSYTFKEHHINDLVSYSKQMAKNSSQIMLDHIFTEEFSLLQDVVAELADNNKFIESAYLVSTNGIIVGDSSKRRVGEKIKKELSENNVRDTRVEINLELNEIKIGTPLIFSGEFYGLLVTVVSMNPMLTHLKNSQFKIVLICFSFWIIITLLSMVGLSRIVKPLVTLEEAVREIIENKNFSKFVNINSQNEIGHLARSFNLMLTSLKETTISRDYVGKVINNMGDGLFVTNSEGVVTLANAAISEMVGYKQKDIIGLKPEVFIEGSLLSLEVGKQCEKQIRTVTGVITPVVISMNRLDGEFVFVLTDLTEQKRVDKERQLINDKIFTLQREAEKEQYRIAKLSSVGYLAAGIAHEIKNPLAIIKGYIEILCSDLENDEDCSMEHVVSINKNIDRISEIIEHLVKFGMSGDLNIRSAYVFKRVAVANLIESALSVVKSELDRNEICVKVKFITDNLSIYCDRYQVEQAIVNIITNSIEAINISGENHKKEIEIVTSLESSQAYIVIRDTGCGISNEIKDRIFDPFFSTKAVNDGKGLGLSLAHEIIRSHKGELTLARFGGHNSVTEFIINIPAVTVT